MSSKAKSDGGELENQFILRVPQVRWVSSRAGVDLILQLVIFGFAAFCIKVFYDHFFLVKS